MSYISTSLCLFPPTIFPAWRLRLLQKGADNQFIFKQVKGKKKKEASIKAARTLRHFISHHPKPNQPKGLTAPTNVGAISPSLQRLMHSSHAFLHIPKVTSEIKCHFSKKFLVQRQPGQCRTLTLKRQASFLTLKLLPLRQQQQKSFQVRYFP